MAQLRARMSQKEEEPEQRNSLLGVRTSYASDSLAPAGPVHPPPAPPLLGLAGNPRKGVLDMAKNRMKQVQWDKLSAEHASSTVWGANDAFEQRLRPIILAGGVFDEMEEEFKAKEASKKAVTAVKKDHKELQTHLNYATRQGIEMVLKRIKSRLTDSKQCTPEEVAHFIIHCDAQVCDQSILTELLRYYPESETKGRLGEYKNASDEQLRLLHPADRLVVLLMTVPHLKDKVKGLLYMTKYADTVDLIRTGLGKIRDGAEAIMHAPKFAELLSIVLMFGNYLNATGIKGGAFGFRISSINKLVDTKAGDGTTLLHFVERTVSQHFPELDGFTDELHAATEACRVQLLDLKHDLAELKSGNTQHKKELDRLLGEHEENLEDPYAKLMLPFLQKSTSELSKLNDQIQHTERVFTDALRFYGEGPDPIRRGFVAPKPMPTEEFFGIFKEFLAAYRKCKTDNAVRAQQRAQLDGAAGQAQRLRVRKQRLLGERHDIALERRVTRERDAQQPLHVPELAAQEQLRPACGAAGAEVGVERVAVERLLNFGVERRGACGGDRQDVGDVGGGPRRACGAHGGDARGGDPPRVVDGLERRGDLRRGRGQRAEQRAAHVLGRRVHRQCVVVVRAPRQITRRTRSSVAHRRGARRRMHSAHVDERARGAACRPVRTCTRTVHEPCTQGRHEAPRTRGRGHWSAPAPLRFVLRASFLLALHCCGVFSARFPCDDGQILPFP